MTNTYNRDLHTHTIKEYDVQQSSNSVKGFTFGFSLGIALGSLIGLALAPKPGRELQQDINDKVVSLKSNAEDKGNSTVEQLKDKAVEIKQLAAEKAEEVKALATEKVDQAKAAVAQGDNEPTAEELAAQHRAIKEEVNDDTLKEPIAIVDKELENSKKTKNSKKKGK